jgi:Glycosyltransferase family 87
MQRLARAGADVVVEERQHELDGAGRHQLIRRRGPPGYPGQNWPNPPTALVVMAPFGLLNYFPALLAWFSVSGLAFYLAGRPEVADLRTLAIVLVSPAALMCVLSGQSSLLTTAALLAIFASLDERRSWRAC